MKPGCFAGYSHIIVAHSFAFRALWLGHAADDFIPDSEAAEAAEQSDGDDLGWRAAVDGKPS